MFFSDSEDEAMFLACLARILSKRGSALEDSFSVDELKTLHRQAVLFGLSKFKLPQPFSLDFS